MGFSVIGRFKGFKSGHAMNSKLLDKLISDEKAYEIVTFEKDAEKMPISFVPAAAAVAV